MAEEGTKRLGEILIERGWLTVGQLQEALLEQKGTDKFLGAILREKGIIDSRMLAEAIAQQAKLPFVDVKSQHLDFELAARFSTSLIVDHQCFPLFEDDSSYTVAVVNPLDGACLSLLEEQANPKTIKLMIAAEEDMQAVLQSFRQYISQSIQRMLWKKKPTKGIG